MATGNNTFINTSPFRIVLPYLVVSVLWVCCSDYVLRHIVHNVNLVFWIHSFKDLVFVVVTVVILYLLVRRHIKAITTAYHEKIRQGRIYRGLIENGNDVIMISDRDGKYIYVTDNTALIFGYNMAEFRSMSLFEIIHPDDYMMMKVMTEDIIAHPSKIYRAEYRVFHKSGTVIWVEGVKVNHLDDPDIGGIVTNARDISKRKKAQMDLVDLNMELEQKVKDSTASLIDALEKEKNLNKMKSRFVAFASHEFRTPLTGILASASLIKKYEITGQQDQRLRHIDRIVLGVSNLTDILNDFLSAEQLESGAIEKGVALFSLPVFMDEVMADMDGMLDKKNQRIMYRHEGADMVIQSNKILRNVLLNLLSNASKYSPEGKQIQLTSSVAGDQIVITVKDNGIGIPEEDQEKLFTGFFRASNVDHVQGTGLGLSIVKKYVELMGGCISFVSKLNRGTTFTVDLPLTTAVKNTKVMEDAGAN